MKLQLENIFIFLVVLADFSRRVSSLNPKCHLLTIVNGRARYSWRGRSVRFNCMRGFQLVGVKYMTCINGEWDSEIPICVKAGCRAPSTTHVNGQFIESYRGAVLRVVCNAGYTLNGSSVLYCNGYKWSASFPGCRVNNSNPALSCDFETPDLCGWSQDPMHDFDWRRENGTTVGGAIVGPLFDHTKGTNGTGHYMSVERSNARVENETARLYSPVYPAEYSNGTCFKFWYYVHGSVTGSLKVFLKPEGVELYNLIPMFWITDDQGDVWRESFFSISPMETPFQIVVEGVKGTGGVGDMAFDDVSLTPWQECKILEEMTSSTEFSVSVTPDEDYNDIPTCKNRCNEERTNSTGRGYDRCSCHETCERDGSCCPDYSAFCTGVFVSSSPTTAQTDTKMSSSISSSPAKVPSVDLVPTTKSTPKPPPALHDILENNDIPNEIPLVPSGKIPSPVETPNREQTTTPRAVRNSTTASRNAEKKAEILPERKPVNMPAMKTEVNPEKKAEKAPETKPKKESEIKAEKIPEIKPEKKLETKPEKRPETKIEKLPEAKPEKKPEVKMKKNPEKKAEKVPEKKAGKLDTKTQTGNDTKGASKVDVSPEGNKTIVAAMTPTGVPGKSPKSRFQDTFLGKSSSTNLENEFKFIKKPKEGAGKELPQAIKVDKNDEKTGGSLRGIVEIGGAGVALLIIIIFGVLWYKRSEHKKTERENMVEDSDSIVYKMDETVLGNEFHSLVCILPGGLRNPL